MAVCVSSCVMKHVWTKVYSAMGKGGKDLAYFPFFVDIEGKRWLIVGGGEVAFRKVRDLLPYGARIRVVAPVMVPGLLALAESGNAPDQLLCEQRGFEDNDLEGIDFVVAATASPSLNSHISSMCREQRIPVNVVDVKDECSFIFPSIVRDGPVVVGISTGGASPVIARYLKDRVKAALPEGLGMLAAQLGEYRERVKTLFPESPRVRSSLFYELAEEGIAHDCVLTKELAETIIRRKLEQEHE